jgi:hypothetical protein
LGIGFRITNRRFRGKETLGKADDSFDVTALAPRGRFWNLLFAPMLVAPVNNMVETTRMLKNTPIAFR